eukprot:TRINITY_DN15707_c0_g1_i1.p1 TRINITY_DN15707_c0_g1~~TRINITY_DN15707_c0_g1_i1.p1  ORF type:complete len:228 (+),score=23.43 TRINITY_DN15707_c0_g1_i1:25-684(+)
MENTDPQVEIAEEASHRKHKRPFPRTTTDKRTIGVQGPISVNRLKSLLEEIVGKGAVGNVRKYPNDKTPHTRYRVRLKTISMAWRALRLADLPHSTLKVWPWQSCRRHRLEKKRRARARARGDTPPVLGDPTAQVAQNGEALPWEGAEPAQKPQKPKPKKKPSTPAPLVEGKKRRTRSHGSPEAQARHQEAKKARRLARLEAEKAAAEAQQSGSAESHS